MRRIGKALALLVMIAAVGLLIMWLRSSPRSFENLDQEMGHLVSGLVEKDASVRNCVLTVMRGDGSYSWAGAAGIASQQGQVPMTKDTPIYIASITKLYTATAIMRLVERGVLSLDDPMWKYLPQNLFVGGEV
jgi:D-alanyl-D-alanine carboxypeptidase